MINYIRRVLEERKKQKKYRLYLDGVGYAAALYLTEDDKNHVTLHLNACMDMSIDYGIWNEFDDGMQIAVEHFDK